MKRNRAQGYSEILLAPKRGLEREVDTMSLSSSTSLSPFRFGSSSPNLSGQSGTDLLSSQLNINEFHSQLAKSKGGVLIGSDLNRV
ncbi:unnamed protein product, partial [Didymodactylos carnosus]